jgi:integrase
MGKRKPLPGLRLRHGIWHIDKRYKYFSGGRLQQSTGFGEKDLEKAEAYLVHQMETARLAAQDGKRPDRTFQQAATKYLLENTHKASIGVDGYHLEQLMPFIGQLALKQVHDGTLAGFIKARKQQGVKQKSINNALGVVRRILNLAARSWRDEYGLTWLETPPLLTLPSVRDAAKPYPLSWDEQRQLFSRLPKHLAEMALFKVNTGLRDQEVCQLQWQWEVTVPELKTSVFLIPAFIETDEGKQGLVKNREERLVVLNSTAKSVVDARRGCHPQYVFTYKCKPILRMHNNGWKRAWKDSGLPVCGSYTKGVHNLKHTFGRRLRAAGVPLETRKVLLGHTNGDITSHYSAPEIKELLDAVNKVCNSSADKMPTLTLLKRQAAN